MTQILFYDFYFLFSNYIFLERKSSVFLLYASIPPGSQHFLQDLLLYLEIICHCAPLYTKSWEHPVSEVQTGTMVK